MIQMAQPHGDARFHDNYNVNELLIEYELLRRIITEEIADHFARDLTTDEIVALNIGIDTAARRSVVRFVHHLVTKMRKADDLHARYISFLNHDLRGGMNGVLLVAEVLKRELAAEPRLPRPRRFRRHAAGGASDGGAMDRFVFASRLVRGQYQPKYHPMEIKPLLEELISAESEQAQERGIEFVFDIAEGCTVRSNLELSRFILENLLNNTIKHAKPGGGKVRITVKPREAGGCIVAVADQGSGIDAEHLKTILSSAAAHRPGERNRHRGWACLFQGKPLESSAANLPFNRRWESDRRLRWNCRTESE